MVVAAGVVLAVAATWPLTLELRSRLPDNLQDPSLIAWQLAWAGHALNSDGIVDAYEGLLDGLVADERASDIPTLETDVEMGDAEARRRVAREALNFAAALQG